MQEEAQSAYSMALDRYRRPHEDDYDWTLNCGKYDGNARSWDVGRRSRYSELATYPTQDTYDVTDQDFDCWDWDSPQSTFRGLTQYLSQSMPVKITGMSWTATSIPGRFHNHSETVRDHRSIRRRNTDRSRTYHQSTQSRQRDDEKLVDEWVSSASSRARHAAEQERIREVKRRRDFESARVEDMERREVEAEEDHIRDIERVEAEEDLIRDMQNEEMIRHESVSTRRPSPTPTRREVVDEEIIIAGDTDDSIGDRLPDREIVEVEDELVREDPIRVRDREDIVIKIKVSVSW